MYLNSVWLILSPENRLNSADSIFQMLMWKRIHSMIFTNSQLTHNLLDLGFDSSLVRSFGLQEATPELTNVFSAGTAPRTIIAGELITVLEQQAGVVFSGKTAFSNATAGYRLGIEN